MGSKTDDAGRRDERKSTAIFRTSIRKKTIYGMSSRVGGSAAASIIADAFANEPFYRLRKFGNCVPEAAELRNVPEDSARTRLS